MGSFYNVLNPQVELLAIIDIGLARCLTLCKLRLQIKRASQFLTGHLTARADDGHALPLGLLGKAFNLTFILPSPLVRFSVLN